MSGAPRIVLLFAAAAAVAAVAATASAQTPQLPLTLEEATRRTLERNTTLAVERENVEQAGFAILRARGAYDVLWNADVGWQQQTDPVNSAFSGAPGGGSTSERSASLTTDRTSRGSESRPCCARAARHRRASGCSNSARAATLPPSRSR